ncbi:Hypothetical protein KNT65_gp097 [Escherichia phage EcS1]|uniref:Uncharacterized protein n=1 Tax=Escherichia phage EcS1 TaxID=2083276 RepID=A0A2Z5ZCF0_9CAUD|nr:Hypothetical protein KNT65_gp097 [Escherichia phage EcS1]BBC78145.1 Hypothetical protein [Escherichia phage EcS1]
MSALVKYDIKFKRFVNGVWDEKFRITTVTAENQYQAVWHLGTYNDDPNIEDVIVMVSSENGNPNHFAKGAKFITNGGEEITIEGITGTGTSYETAYDQHGHHRYSRRDVGRATGSSGNDPYNVNMGVFWMRYDIDDPYDYIMQRKYSDNYISVQSNETVKTCL